MTYEPCGRNFEATDLEVSLNILMLIFDLVLLVSSGLILMSFIQLELAYTGKFLLLNVLICQFENFEMLELYRLLVSEFNRD